MQCVLRACNTPGGLAQWREGKVTVSLGEKQAERKLDHLSVGAGWRCIEREGSFES